MPISLADTINNPKKVSINLLSEEDAQTYEVGEKNDVIMVIYVPNIFNIWADEGWEEPIIEERFDPDRTVLTLSEPIGANRNRVY